jgi:hypothetical protein
MNTVKMRYQGTVYSVTLYVVDYMMAVVCVLAHNKEMWAVWHWKEEWLVDDALESVFKGLVVFMSSFRGREWSDWVRPR